MEKLLELLPAKFLMIVIIFLLTMMVFGKVTIADKEYDISLGATQTEIELGSAPSVVFEEFASEENADIRVPTDKNKPVESFYKNVVLECPENEVLTALKFNVGKDVKKQTYTIVSYSAKCGKLKRSFF